MSVEFDGKSPDDSEVLSSPEVGAEAETETEAIGNDDKRALDRHILAFEEMEADLEFLEGRNDEHKMAKLTRFLLRSLDLPKVSQRIPTLSEFELAAVKVGRFPRATRRKLQIFVEDFLRRHRGY